MSILFDPNENLQTRRKRPDSKQSHNQKSKHEDLLVFGYQCKLFRDDATALVVNEGKQLIPWMGNEDLMIDR